jgi:hypothetical protein
MKSFSVIVALFALCATLYAGQSKVLELRAETKPSDRIEIGGISGSDVKFRSWEKNEVYVKLNVSISCWDKDYEQEYVEKTHLAQEASDGTVRISLEELSTNPSFSLFSFLTHPSLSKNITGEVFVPESNALTSDFRYGSMELNDMKGELRLLGTSNTVRVRNCTNVSEIENNYGSTTIEDCGGALRLTGASSTVYISDFAGSARVDANYSTVSVKGIDKELTLTDQSGKLTLERLGGSVSLDANYSTIGATSVGGDLRINCQSGTIRVSGVRGQCDFDAKYSSIELDSVANPTSKPSVIDDQSGSVYIEGLTGGLRIDNPYGDITLMKIKGNVRLSSTSSRVEGDDITGDFDARTLYTSISMRGLRANAILITDQSNPVSLHLASVPESLSVVSQYADVRVTMPAGFSGDVDLTVEYGRLVTNLPLKIKELQSSSYGTGKIGSGAGSISLSTKSGNIELNEVK